MYSDTMRDPFLDAAIEQARKSLAEGGIPIGSVLVHERKIIGEGITVASRPAARSITER